MQVKKHLLTLGCILMMLPAVAQKKTKSVPEDTADVFKFYDIEQRIIALEYPVDYFIMSDTDLSLETLTMKRVGFVDDFYIDITDDEKTQEIYLHGDFDIFRFYAGGFEYRAYCMIFTADNGEWMYDVMYVVRDEEFNDSVIYTAMSD